MAKKNNNGNLSASRTREVGADRQSRAARQAGGRKLATRQSVDQAVKSICDIMRRGNCAGALQYVPELTWILFLRILDEREELEQREAEALGVPFQPSLEHPYRWQDWAAPGGPKRKELQEGAPGSFFGFVNTELLRYLKGLKNRPDASPRRKVVSEVMTGVERVRIDTERNFLDVLDKVNEITAETVDPTHVFTLSQVYEGLLLKMGEKGNDGGQFFTPRQVIKAMVQVIAPAVNETVYDPGCGTGGFLAQSYEFTRDRLGGQATAEQLETLKQRTFWGREKENLIYPIALANLVLHGIDKPNLPSLSRSRRKSFARPHIQGNPNLRDPQVEGRFRTRQLFRNSSEHATAPRGPDD